MSTVRRVAIIGGGCSGLAASKTCVDEGLTPVVLERTDEVGGLWRYSEKVKDGQSCVMRSTVMMFSKEMMCYSDFPVPRHWPNFMHNSLVIQYFRDYAERFELRQHVRYNTEVLALEKAVDFAATGRWTLNMMDHKSGEETTETFDAVMVCTGHHAEKHEPAFPGLGDFQGQVLHSHDYREPSHYLDKRVLIIGIGNSGADLAVELSRQGQVLLSTRRGAWLLNRVAPGGLPFDIVMMRRIHHLINRLLPLSVVNALLKRKIKHRLDHDLYGLTSDYPPLAQYGLVNDDLVNRIVCGSVTVKADVQRFTATGVQFVDGSFEDNIDLVLLATGYKFDFPFIEKSVVDVKDNRLSFFKYMFPPDLQHHTLAVIGCIQTLGAVMPIAELQCRLATRVFKGDVKLPSPSEMWDDIHTKEAAMARRYVKSQRHTVQVDWLQFMDEVAELTGCKPGLVSLFKSDPLLAKEVLLGPCTPYQFRLQGPGQWAGARQAIMTAMDRVRYPLATRPLPAASQKGVVQSWGVWLVVVVVVLFYLLRYLLRAVFR